MRDVYRRFYDDTQAMSTKIIREEMEAGLQASTKKLFATFDETPMATGSLGQIHRVTSHEGDAWIVKVRYPGVKETVERDLKILRLALPFLTSKFPKAEVEKIFELNYNAAIEECDFRAEATKQITMAALYADNPDILIPKVALDYTAENVITMDHIDGRRLDEFLRHADEASRVKASRQLLRAVYTNLFCHPLVNPDPHPGNVLFLEDGRLAMVDFGMARPFDPARQAQFRDLLASAVAGDRQGFEEIHRDLGYAAVYDAGYGDNMFTFYCQGIAAPFMTDRYRFSKEAVALARRGFNGQDPKRPRVLVPDDYVLPRFYIALMATMCAFDVEADYRDILDHLHEPVELAG